MNNSHQLAKHLREVYFGGNWTDVCLKETLDGVSLQQASTIVHSLNTILALVYHIGYYVTAVTKVLQHGPLDSSDKYSFNHPDLQSEEAWQQFLNQFWADAETFAGLVEQVPEPMLWETFVAEKYGNYFRNIQGVIEHSHYHLGQIVLIKKLLPQVDNR